MNKRLEGILQVIFAIAVIFAVFVFSSQIESLSEFGYLGVFLISMFSTATLFFPAPGWATVIAMSSFLNPFAVGIFAGIGAGIGEITGYVAGDGILDIIQKNNRLEVESIKSQIKKYGMPAIFFLSFFPNPVFDVSGIIAGSIRMGWWRFLIPCIAGRVLRYVLLAYFGSLALRFVY